jgi:hypothetical protein
LVGLNPITKTAAYEIFAIFINNRSPQDLHLTGKQLSAQVDAYKKKFSQKKDWAENTGAGIDNPDGGHTLAEILEKKCMCAIFGSKHNVTPLVNYNSVSGAGAPVPMGSEDNDKDTEQAEELTEHL